MQPNTKKEAIGIAALYCRLSKDDGTNSESNSIATQKQLLSKKAKELGYAETRCYIDDGYTGTNFNRPGFQKLLDDIDMGIVSAVLVKDLSRLGRDYIGVGYYTDSYFPDRDIRFVAVNDMLDSTQGECEIAPFKNIMNEWYARDISRKTRSSHRIRGNMGVPLSQPPYGYIKSPEDIHKWIIDPEPAKVVQRIFKMALEGISNDMIAQILRAEKIMFPLAYWQSKGINRGGKRTQSDPFKWNMNTVIKILNRQEYCGDIINFKTYSKSFKNKKRHENPKENWTIFKDVHEPIIDRDTFELVQEKIKNTKRRRVTAENSHKSIFSDLLYCADCGSKLWYHTNTANRDIHFFSCRNYKKDFHGTCASRHYIREDALYAIVSMELNRLADYLCSDEESFVELLAKKTRKEFDDRKRNLEQMLKTSLSRLDTITGLFSRLYEDNVSGKITDEWFVLMSGKYNNERTELKDKIELLKDELNSIEDSELDYGKFVKSVRHFMNMRTLTAPLLKELIDHIDVFERQGAGKNCTQRIVIYYRFVGCLDYQQLPGNQSFTSCPRDGVSITYIADAI